ACLNAAGPRPPLASTKKPMPLTQLAPAVLKPDQCTLRYRITTDSADCQAYFDQGLGYLYSYVWMEAARSFETATQPDPNCPMAHWGLARAMVRYGRDSTGPLKKAWELRERASPREQMLIKAMMEERGLLPGVGDPEARKKKAIATIDDMIAT